VIGALYELVGEQAINLVETNLGRFQRGLPAAI